jgi:hypothetical protein
MDREPYSDEDLIEREIEELTESPDPPKDTEMERRAGPDVIHHVNPYPPRERNEATYGESDTDPRREDEPTVHHAEEDEHL